MKPEKVKSRWRRSSEMECCEKAGASPLEFDLDGSSDVCIKETAIEVKSVSNDSVDGSESVNESIPVYDVLEENLYLFERKRTKRKKEVRRMLCDCSLNNEEKKTGVLGCLDECLNRLLMIECGSRCATGDACSNKRFQKRQYVKAEPFKTDKKGWGLKLLENVPMGTFVIEYVGEIISRKEFKQRVKQYAREKSKHYYFMALRSDEIIDATNKGNLSRFMNHSCDPNCETQKWTVNGELRIGFFAKRDLKAGEELTFDYRFQRYGRLPQKCYCGSSICSGYIGLSSQISLDINTSKTGNKRKKPTEEKMRDLEDLMLEEEIGKLSEIGGLRNKDDTLMLARLMVRAEDFHSREKLLEILLGTSEVACLRLFLDYHGLSLLWSWMAYLTDEKLKEKILRVLKLLPVPNKTLLLDSKVMNVIEKWASPVPNIGEGDYHSADLSDYPAHKELTVYPKKVKSCDTSDSEPDGIACVQPSESCFISSNLSQSTEVKSNNIVSASNLNNVFELHRGVTGSNVQESTITNGFKNNIADSSRSDEDSADVPDERDTIKFNKTSVELSTLARSLLDSWKDLKKVFRIPRRESQKPKVEGFAEKDNHGGLNEICKNCNIPHEDFCKQCEPKHHDEKPFERSNVFTELSMDEKPRKVLLPTPPLSIKEERQYPISHLLTKEEKRKQFAKKIQQKDQRDAKLRKHLKHPNTSDVNGFPDVSSFASDSVSYFNATDENYSFVDPSYKTSGSTISPYDQYYYNTKCLQSPRPALLPTPGTESTTINPGSLPSIPDNSATIMYTPNVLYPPHHPSPQVPYLGGVPPPIPQQPQNVALFGPQTTTLPPVSNLIGTGSVTSPSVVSPTARAMGTETAASNNMSSNLYNDVQNSSCISAHTVISASPVTHGYASNQSGQKTMYCSPYAGTSAVEQISASQSYTVSENTNGETTLKSSPVKLPVNWKTATDSEGNIYYYHIITRQTQWDPPEFDESSENIDDGTPSYDEPKISKKKNYAIVQLKVDSSGNPVTVEIAKKIKELFRTKMSKFVVECLNPYRRQECRVGRITNNDDFKHLARKLTHFVMAKELKHCKNVEDLECNDNVKHKARDFIHKYMSKYGPAYKKEKCETPDDD
ncbi:histone-lysine N-methyltransferase SETD2-like isoform X2 [Stegodyphus dumicola]|uniref:histone-lysine N-methyltransferase SETD2-like isoform X2 n=1 Tax=Stegodyphus dumicola TaxID=202533 RepID=UPI0015AAD246|nr:histone-lysine N-methyltransferase SETD2-like isoform X2 [Stegodyphus dumicola]